MLLLRQLGPEGLKAKLMETRREESAGEWDVAVDDRAGKVDVAGVHRGGNSLSRKAQARARLMVDAQRHRPLLEAHVYRAYDSPLVRGEVARHLDVLKNLQRQVTSRVAVAYQQPPARSLRGVSEGEEGKFLRAYREAKTDVLAEKWGRYAFFLSVVHVIPRYERGKLVWVTVTPDKADVIFDPNEDEPSILVYETHALGAVYVAVDSERWWWISDTFEVLHEEEHGMGMRPWVEFRFQDPPELDYWDRGAGQDLFDGTLEIGRVYAHARWVRKNWSKKLLTIHAGENVNVPEGQNIGANQPVMSRGSGAMDFQIHDVSVPIKDFEDEMAVITASVLEQYGLTTEDRSAKSEALVKIRAQQIKHFERAELELAVRATAILKANGALSLTPDQVRDSFRVLFAAPRDADHAKDRMETAKAKMALGQTDPYEVYVQEHPGTTREEARDYVREHVTARAEFFQVWTEHNMPLDPADDLKTMAEFNGKLGGLMSGESRAQPPNPAEQKENTDERPDKQ